MVVFRELGICLFDSTSPHEYFPERPEDEIIDIYAACVKQGTDEEYAEKLEACKKGYKNAIGQATSFFAAYRSNLQRLDTANPDRTPTRKAGAGM